MDNGLVVLYRLFGEGKFDVCHKVFHHKYNPIASEAADDKSPQGPAPSFYFNLAYDAGLGAKNSQGLGMVELVRQIRQKGTKE